MAAENYQKQKKNVLIPIEINLIEMCMVRIQFFLFQIKVKGKKKMASFSIFFPHTHSSRLSSKKERQKSLWYDYDEILSSNTYNQIRWLLFLFHCDAFQNSLIFTWIYDLQIENWDLFRSKYSFFLCSNNFSVLIMMAFHCNKSFENDFIEPQCRWCGIFAYATVGNTLSMSIRSRRYNRLSNV